MTIDNINISTLGAKLIDYDVTNDNITANNYNSNNILQYYNTDIVAKTLSVKLQVKGSSKQTALENISKLLKATSGQSTITLDYNSNAFQCIYDGNKVDEINFNTYELTLDFKCIETLPEVTIKPVWHVEKERNMIMGTSEIEKGDSNNAIFPLSYPLVIGHTYAFTCLVKANHNMDASVYVNDDSGKSRVALNFARDPMISITTDYQQITFVATVTQSDNFSIGKIRLHIYSTDTTAVIYTKNEKMVEGNQVRAYSKALEDVYSDNIIYSSSAEASYSRLAKIDVNDSFKPYKGQYVKIEFDCKATTARTLKVYAYQSNGVSIINQDDVIAVTTGYKHFVIETTIMDYGIVNPNYLKGNIAIYDDTGANTIYIKNITATVSKAPMTYSSTITNAGTAKTPMLIEAVPTKDMVNYSIADVEISDLTANHSYVIDGKNGLITDNGANKAKDSSFIDFPKLDVGENTIVVSSAIPAVTIKYCPVIL